MAVQRLLTVAVIGLGLSTWVPRAVAQDHPAQDQQPAPDQQGPQPTVGPVAFPKKPEGPPPKKKTKTAQDSTQNSAQKSAPDSTQNSASQSGTPPSNAQGSSAPSTSPATSPAKSPDEGTAGLSTDTTFPGEKSDSQPDAPAGTSGNQELAPAGAPDYSSSKWTKVPGTPAGEDLPEGGPGVSRSGTGESSSKDIEEFKPFDPHRSQKDVEVGDYYFNRRNYAAAESRYLEALAWKDRDAVATYKLALAQEKLGKLDLARSNYEAYLQILPQGEYAKECRKALERLGEKASNR